MNKPLLVCWQTSQTSKKELIQQQKRVLIESFQKFARTHCLNLSHITTAIQNHGRYLQMGSYYFRYNSKLPFLQEFRSKPEQFFKLNTFYKIFNGPGSRSQPSLLPSSWFWTITRKTFRLENPTIIVNTRVKVNDKGEENAVNMLRVNFPAIDQAEANLMALFKRLKRYGFRLEKYILVPEIKDNGQDQVNYHYHMLVQASADIAKIRSNPNPVYRDLVYDPKLGQDRCDGFINNAVLSAIWKDVTKDGSYRIRPESIRKRDGALHYLLSYLNKPMNFRNPDMVPYMYFALKSKKAYRVSGTRRLPKVKCHYLDTSRVPIVFDFHRMQYLDKEDIKVDKQEYIKEISVNGVVVKSSLITEYFNDCVQYERDDTTLHQYLGSKRDRYVKRLEVQP